MNRFVYVIPVAVVIAWFAFTHYYDGNTLVSKIGEVPVNRDLDVKTIAVGSALVEVEIADTDAERELGLSNRSSLRSGTGMLFIFDPPRQVSFWMKDMRFSVDMIFAKKDGTIVNIVRNVPPESYPTMIPSLGAVRYVLEVPAGYAKNVGIAVGQKIVVQ